MSLFEHLEELQQRIFYALIAVAEHRLLLQSSRLSRCWKSSSGRQVSPAGSRRILFVSIKVAGYSGLLIASPFVLYVIQFVLGLTRRERRLIGPVVLGSVLFVAGLVFAYLLLIPAALNFFINYRGGCRRTTMVN